MWMNRWEIDCAAERYQDHPVLGKATQFLQRFRDLIDANSDGWCYWRLPIKAAEKLMNMIQKPETATPEMFKKALTPIKSFCTRHKLPMP
jgi:hypothetical protein